MNFLQVSAFRNRGVRAAAIISAVSIISVLVYFAALALKDTFEEITGVAEYLTWHNIFELCGTLVSVAVFLVTYVTHDQTKRLRPLVLGCALLAAGIIFLLHTLSFKGMPDFFIANTEANRATTFWIIASLTESVGCLAAGLVDTHSLTRIRKSYALIITWIFCAVVFYTATFTPHVFPKMYNETTGLTEIKIAFEYMIIILFITAAVLYIAEYLRGGDYVTLPFAAALIIRAFSEYAFTSYFSVYDVYNYIGHIYKFIFVLIIFRVVFIKNVRQPYIDLISARNEIKEYADNLDKLVEQRTEQLQDMNMRLLQDLEYARDIQKAVLPKVKAVGNKVGFDARYFPAERVSGDFYNIFNIDEDNVGMYIGDVSGHGVPAAMLTIFINQSINAARESGDHSHMAAHPSEVLKNLYISYNNTTFSDDIYIILLYAVYNSSMGTLTYASAGMNTQPVLIKNSGELIELEAEGMPLCMLMEYHHAVYRDYKLDLEPGDKLFFYTDGLFQAADADGNPYTLEKLKHILNSNSGYSASALVSAVDNSLSGYMMKKLKDDITFFALETF